MPIFPTRRLRLLNIAFTFLLIQAVMTIQSCSDSAEKQITDDTVYEIKISASSVEESPEYFKDWQNEAAKPNVQLATLYRSLNPAAEYGHISVSKWPSFESLKLAYNYVGKPSDTLHRAYRIAGSARGLKSEEYTETSDFTYVIILFDVPYKIFGEQDPLPNWATISQFMVEQEGFVSATFYKCTVSDAKYRYLNIVKWRSLIDYHKVLGDVGNFFNKVIKNNNLRVNANTYSLAEQKISPLSLVK